MWHRRHPAPSTRGGELGYSLAHAYGAAFDNPDLLVACVIGDGEAETGPLAAAWHSNKFVDPARDGVVLPILHLNGYKIANPAVMARIGDDELAALLTGYGHKPYLVQGDDPGEVHGQLAATMDHVLAEIRAIQATARAGQLTGRPQWPSRRSPRAGGDGMATPRRTTPRGKPERQRWLAPTSAEPPADC